MFFLEKELYISCDTLGDSPLETVLLNALRIPSSLKKLRSVLCGLDIRFCLHPFYGILTGTKQELFYDAVQNLICKQKIRSI